MPSEDFLCRMDNAAARRVRGVVIVGDDAVSLWDLTNLRLIAAATEIGTSEARGKTVNAIAFSPDGRFLAVGSNDGVIKLFTLALD